ncbi:Uma2 family endonuclease [Spirochaeta dissipatitropha]
MGIPKHKAGLFTYADYLTWPDDERWELIGGVAYSMSPASNRLHQQILGRLYRRLAEITDRGSCETYLAPFDIRLSETPESPEAPGASEVPGAPETITTVVQPDISVFCRPEVLDDHGANGAPDIAVEILSPATSHKDQTEKLALYERHGVREYWLVNGESRFVMVYRLGDHGRYGKPDYYNDDDHVLSRVLDGAQIPLSGFC